MKKNDKEKLKTTLKSYMFATPTPEANTGVNIIAMKKGLDSFSKEVDITAKAGYTTSNKKVVTVNKEIVAAVGKGTATVTASFASGPEAGVKFTVK